ncbi:ankyrin repeat-containing domain protein [Coprinopsis sp. MPI-PUGE-AT-0042]|nr:ankyrin repeat-containing domain protein [Coprinopsis sp. MPI-PUGE-AT-0042]
MAYLFIDGLDEALYDEQFDLLDTLKSVPANFFITSRPLVRLKDVLPNIEFFDIAAKNEDIELLVAQHIDRNPDLRQILAADEQRERAIKKICKSSRGMFLHAALMVEALDALYDETFKRIEMQPEEHAVLAKHILLWVVFAYQPLTVDDMQYAVASDPTVDWAAPEDNLVPESLLVSVCCGLIAVEHHIHPALLSDDPSDRIVRLVHYTALDALKRLFLGRETLPHCLLAEVCIERLMNCGVPSNQPDYLHRYAWNRTPSHRKSLLDYAYESWYLHASECLQHPVMPSAQPAASILHFLAMCKGYPTFKDLGFAFSEFDNLTAPIHLVAYYHIPLLLPLIDPQVNELTKEGRTPLSLAAWRNNAAMVELLLKLDEIDVNSQDKSGNTALLVAAEKGSADVVQTLLLDPQINLHKRNNKGESALRCALGGGCSSGHTEAALHLIAMGIDVNAADHLGRTPLMLAYSHPVRLFEKLAQHPDIDLLKRDNNGQTPLMHACRNGTSSPVQWYLRLPGVEAIDHSGASATVHRVQQWGPLSTASEDHVSDFPALIDTGLDVNARVSKGFTALTYAVQYRGTSTVAQALLQLEGVDVNLEDGEGRTLLMVACDALIGRVYYPSQTLDLLLQHPILDVNATNRHGITAVAYAVARGVLAMADGVISSYGQSPSSFGGSEFQDHMKEPLHEVSEMAVHIQFEVHPNDFGGAFAEIVVTGKQSPYPPEFRLSSRASDRIGEEEYRRRLEYLEGLGFGFPWESGWISEQHARCARLLLMHPGVDDHGFAFLRPPAQRPGPFDGVSWA